MGLAIRFCDKMYSQAIKEQTHNRSEMKSLPENFIQASTLQDPSLRAPNFRGSRNGLRINKLGIILMFRMWFLCKKHCLHLPPFRSRHSMFLNIAYRACGCLWVPWSPESVMRNGFKGLIESSSLSHILCQKVAYDAQRAIVYPCLRMNYAAAMWKVSRLVGWARCSWELFPAFCRNNIALYSLYIHLVCCFLVGVGS